MATTEKAIDLQQTIADELAIRIAGLSTAITGLTAASLVQSFDTDGNPLIVGGDGVAGHGNFVVKIMPISWALSKDALGNTAIQYTPHVIKTDWEAVSGGGADPLTTAGKIMLLGCVALRGTEVLSYESGTGTAPTPTTLANDTQVSDFQPQPYYPMVSNQ